MQNRVFSGFFARLTVLAALGAGIAWPARAQWSGAPSGGATVGELRKSSYAFTSHSGQDYSIPNGVALSWSLAGAPSGTAYDVFLSEDSGIGADDLLSSRTTSSSATACNLKIGWTYAWQVKAYSGGTLLGTSDVWTFRTPHATPRWIRVDGGTNMRDLGGRITAEGKMTRQGLLYRTAQFDFYTNSTGAGVVAPGCVQDLRDIGLVSELDLRRGGPYDVLNTPYINYYNHGIYNYTSGVQSAVSYPEVANCFRRMADTNNLPLAFHCAGGADRAGTLALLLECILGWTEEEIHTDYEYTTLCALYQTRDRNSGYYPWMPVVDYLKSWDPAAQSLKVGAWNYLLSIGVTEADLNTIRDTMLADVNGQWLTAIPRQSTWKYNDSGADLGAGWKERTYDDSAWPGGAGALGYGEPGIQTTVSFGSDASAKHETTYFRKTFTFDGDPADVIGLMLYANYDDGFVAWLNGHQLGRGSMKSQRNAVYYNTLAWRAHSSGEYEPMGLSAHTDKVRQGENVLAVEVHQVSPSSSDLVWDAELKIVTRGSTPPQPPAAPSGLTANAVSASRIELSWSDNSGNETGFKIDRRRSGFDTWERIAAPSADATSCSDTGLPAATKFYYKVKAYNAVGHSAESAPAWATTQPEGEAAIGVRVGTSADDAEENVGSGVVNLTSSDLEMIRDGTVDQVVGIRFRNVAIPRGATILGAYVQFTTDDEPTSDAATLRIRGHAADSAGAFTSETGDITARARTEASVDWTPPAWSTAGEAGPAQRTPDLGAVIQEIVDRAGWSGGNALALVVTGSGLRRAASYDYAPELAPLLHVAYTTGTALQPPAAPDSVLATALSASAIRVTWADNSANETGFRLDRRQSGTDAWVRIASPAANATNHTDSGLLADTHYYYKLKAYNSAGESAYSAYDGDTTLPPNTFLSTDEDHDRDGLPDAWEEAMFGDTAGSDYERDTDGDGLCDGDEWVAGTDPLSPVSYLQVMIELAAGGVAVSFQSRPLEGAGYDGFDRRYALEERVCAEAAPWRVVPGYANIPGDGARVAYSIPSEQTHDPRQYRAKTWLERQ
ncbi:MAG: tyrosine-protein phosphatase [Kiritimatiellae bacterium]|nr:tyrosine-protein phosphatase [Kiritimatiellia bacterium]